MAEDKSAQNAVSARPLELAGDSPELIAFALLRYLAQLEQANDDVVFDRAWMLDAYAECLEAVQGNRTRGSGPPPQRARSRKR
ncbi:MAG: hypothetical protein J0H08_10500 [Rhizobiales bacterium]|nr:hypothetical protein [Hyphomicrobiales bacterium]